MRHSLAVEVALKPVLTELGLTCPTRGLFLVDSNYEDADVLDSWSAHARPQVAATMGNLR